MTFGRARRGDFLLDPQLTYLNHGTVGVAHRRVFDAQLALMRETERNPARFVLREQADAELVRGGQSRLGEAMAEVAPFLGTRPEDTVFVDNITAGANAVLRSFPFEAGDEVLVTDHGYGGVTNAAHFAASRAGATLRTVALPWPATDPGDYIAAIAEAIGPSTRLLVVDHLTAPTALVLPLAEIAVEAHRRGVLVLADGAHVPGNIAVDVPALGVDWYTANLHKWALAPRSVGVLWCHPERQATTRPLVTSWGYGNGFRAEFELPGTRDASAALCAPVGIAVLHDYGLAELQRYNRDLAWEAAHLLSEAWATPFSTPRSMLGAMVTVRLPDHAGSDAERVRAELAAQGFELSVHARGEALWARVSAQVYVETEDFERLAAAVERLGG